MDKKGCLGEIDAIVSSGKKAVGFHQEEVKNMHTFADKITEMIAAEAPEFVEKAKRISALITGVADQDAIVCEAEDRLIEDINDLSIRYDALAKMKQTVDSARSSYQSACKKVETCEAAIKADEEKGGAKKAKLEAELQKLNNAKSDAKSILCEHLEKYIDQKEKYAAFTARRLEHGFGNLGATVKATTEVAAHLLEQLHRETESASGSIEEFLTEDHDEPMMAHAEEEKNE